MEGTGRLQPRAVRGEAFRQLPLNSPALPVEAGLPRAEAAYGWGRWLGVRVQAGGQCRSTQNVLGEDSSPDVGSIWSHDRPLTKEMPFPPSSSMSFP